MTPKEQVSGFLAMRIEEFSKARNLILYHGGLNFLADLQISVYQTCRRFLENNSVEQLENTLRSNPDRLHGDIPIEISEDIMSFLKNQTGVFPTVLDLPQYISDKEQKVRDELVRQENEVKRLAKIEKERVAAVEKKRQQDELADKLGVDKDLLAKLRGQQFD